MWLARAKILREGGRQILNSVCVVSCRRARSTSTLGARPVTLHYQQLVEGKAVGRHIGTEDSGTLCDLHQPTQVQMHDARQLMPQASLEARGFEMRRFPSAVRDFKDDAEVRQVYYPEMQHLVQKATGCEKVLVFDHTVRESTVQELNNMNEKGVAAGSVVRVHCDYTKDSAPKRFQQLLAQNRDSLYLADFSDGKGSTVDLEELASRRFAFVNVWRSIRDEPLQTRPLAVCDPGTVDDEEYIRYKMIYPDREGENYALLASPAHKWFYYPEMTKEECLLFKVYERRSDVPRFVFHTAFDDPNAPKDAPPRASIECRAIAIYPKKEKPVFFDMIHSNNAARIRIWLRLKGLDEKDAVEAKFVTYSDLQSEEYMKCNPLRKVPALLDEDGDALFESQVIMEYLEDHYNGKGAVPSFEPGTAKERAYVSLLVRMHDLYIASPNCTQPNFSHTQGAMYLAPYETRHCSAVRAMDRPTRAAKVAELWKQLNWLEQHVKGPYLAGASISHADMTWYPTCIFMEFMLPRVFGWKNIFEDRQHFPRLCDWFELVSESSVFKQTRQEIWDFWVVQESEGQFEPIKDEVKDPSYKWTYP